MKQTLDSLKSKTGSAYVRAGVATAMLVPLAALLGGVRMANHNETLVRDATRVGERSGRSER